MIIVAVSEIGKLNSFLGSVLASIPLVGTLRMIWTYHDKTPLAKITAHSSNVFWMVPACPPMFLLLPWLIETQRWSFYPSLGASVVVTAVLYFSASALLKRYGIVI